MTQLINFLYASIKAGTPLLFGTSGEILTQKSGNMNLGVEGMMYLGAIASFYVGFNTNNFPLAILAAAAAGAFGVPELLVITADFAQILNYYGSFSADITALDFVPVNNYFYIAFIHISENLSRSSAFHAVQITVCAVGHMRLKCARFVIIININPKTAFFKFL